MKKLENIIAENLLRFGVKNLSESNIKRLMILEQEEAGKEKSLTKRINFASGMHSAEKGNVTGVLGPELQAMQDFLIANKGSIVNINLSASESQVTNYDGETNPKTPLAIGDLSKKRYATIETYMKQWLQGLLDQGIITEMPNITASEPLRGTTEYVRGQDNPADPKYTAEQWLEVTLSVSALPFNELDFDKAKASTNRNSQSTWNQYNAQALFYYKSYAAAAVLNKDVNSLPGALLTMNNIFQLRTEIVSNLGKFVLPAFKMTIKPDGGQSVDVWIMDKGKPVGTPNDTTLANNTDGAILYKANVANSYTLVNPFAVGTPEYKNAWIFAWWYINHSYPADWNYISNKPTDINFDELKNLLGAKGDNKIFETSIALQDQWWKRYSTGWYNGVLKRLMAEKSAEDTEE
jgi:hypothetical protein